MLQTYTRTTLHRNVLLVVFCTDLSPRRVSHGTPSLHSTLTAGTEPRSAHWCQSHKSRGVGSQGQPTPLPSKAGQLSGVRHVQPMGQHSLTKSWCAIYFSFPCIKAENYYILVWEEQDFGHSPHSVISTAQHPTNGENPSLTIMKSPSRSFLGVGTRLFVTRLSAWAETALTSAPTLLYS